MPGKLVLPINKHFMSTGEQALSIGGHGIGICTVSVFAKAGTASVFLVFSTLVGSMGTKQGGCILNLVTAHKQ